MKYMSENVASETEVSVMLKASSGGQKYQLSQRATNLLKLKDNSPATLSQFNEAYGDYLIVGWIYGGAILYESKYSAQSSSDKMEVEAGLWYVDPPHIALVHWKPHRIAFMFTKRIVWWCWIRCFRMRQCR